MLTSRIAAGNRVFAGDGDDQFPWYADAKSLIKRIESHEASHELRDIYTKALDAIEIEGLKIIP